MKRVEYKTEIGARLHSSSRLDRERLGLGHIRVLTSLPAAAADVERSDVAWSDDDEDVAVAAPDIITADVAVNSGVVRGMELVEPGTPSCSAVLWP